ncbi:hypothetical protein N431DRAFT_437570 [Stipitochalara longipes BDJ]|nr:hypothetical protein N431DRAFT_437570 [Stipitochalara longipes BDJ]
MLSLCSFRSIVFLVYALDTSNALEFAPTPTWATVQSSALAWDNLPTITAGAFNGDLKARATNQQNPICGWIGGNGASAVSCGANYYCATESTFVGCCATASCAGIVTACYDLLGSICDAGCQNNIGNLVCSSTLPYCATYEYEGGSVGYGCAVARGYTVSVLVSITTSDGGRLTTGAPTTTAASSTFAAPSTSLAAASGSSKSGLGGGPIAGIVIGSIAVIALVAFLVFLLLRNQRKHREEIKALREENPYPLQDRNSRVSQPYSATGGYYFQNKETNLPGSPPLSDTPDSPYGSNFARTPRDIQQPHYIGPPIPEMATGDDHERREERH